MPTPTTDTELHEALRVLFTSEPGADLDRAAERIAGSPTAGPPARIDLETAVVDLLTAGEIELAGAGYRRVPPVAADVPLREAMRNAMAAPTPAAATEIIDQALRADAARRAPGARS